MTKQEPIGELDTDFSSPGATATPWAEARKNLEDAEIFWLSTVRPDGRPHVLRQILGAVQIHDR